MAGLNAPETRDSVTIMRDLVCRLINKMRALMPEDARMPQDATDYALRGSHHLILQEHTGADLSHDALVEEIDKMDPDHPHQPVARTRVGARALVPKNAATPWWWRHSAPTVRRPDTCCHVRRPPPTLPATQSRWRMTTSCMTAARAAVALVGVRHLGKAVYIPHDDELRRVQ